MLTTRDPSLNQGHIQTESKGLEEGISCKWIECSNQKTKTGQTDARTKPLYMLSTRDPPQTQGYIQTENEGLEKIFCASGNQKKVETKILMSDRL